MTRTAFLKKYLLRFSATLALLGLLIYVFFHVFSAETPPMTTPAYLHTDYQIVGGEAYLFREERLLTVKNAGVVQHMAESGEKVSRGEAVAEVWDGYSDVERHEAQIELDFINRMIDLLEESRVGAGSTLSKAELFRREAEKTYAQMRQMIVRGDVSELQKLEDNMLVLLNRYRTLIGGEDGVEESLEALKAARENFWQGTPYRVYNSEASGYFYDAAQIDGYESIFTVSALESLTPQGLEALALTEADRGADFPVGKMVFGSRWYLAIPFDSSYSAFFEGGGRYDFRFPENRGRELTMLCERTVAGEDGGILAVFSTDEIPTDFTYLRTQRVEITVGSYTGYHVPEAAMRVRDGVEGVYVFEESTVRFRRVEVLYRGNGYCIVAEQGDRGKEYLALNDMMITSGEDLFEGRVYR